MASSLGGHPLLISSAAAAPAPKIQICHIPPGNPANWHTITISEKALKAHLKHGDLPGACGEHCESLCDDANACTVDACDASDSCVYEPVDCTDGNICTADACNPATGCEYVAQEGDVCPVDDDLPCTQDTGQCVADDLTIALCEPDMVPGCCMIDEECADEDLCTIQTCGLDNRCAHTGDITCATDACHVSACNPTTGDCSVPEEILCEELECHATACEPGTPSAPGAGCVTVPIEGCCVSAEECDDGNNCTTDVCHGVNGCSNDPCAAGDACTTLLGCEADCTPITEWVYCEDDGDLCTVESCAPGEGCVSDGIVCDEDATCDPATGDCVTADATVGNEFIFLFEDNNNATSILTLFISSKLSTSGVVEIASIGFSEPFSVTPGNVAAVVLPYGSDLNTVDVIETDAAVRVAATQEVQVYAVNHRSGSSDAFAVLPVTSLGQEHFVMAWPGQGMSEAHRSQLAVAATEDGTTVTITPTADVGTLLAGVPYTITLDRLDAYQLMSTGDLTGSSVVSDKPIAVFGGNQCAQIPVTEGYSDHLAEQTPPIELWGHQHLSLPLATRSGGDTFRVLAAEDNTSVLIIGPPGVQSVPMNAGEFLELSLDGNYSVSSGSPILVAQYSNGTTYDGQLGDPSMMLVPPAERFLKSYTFSTPVNAGFTTNYLNVMAFSANVQAGTVLLDGVPLPAGAFTAMPWSSYVGAQIPISVGAHTLQAPAALGMVAYGFGSYRAYGYSGGFSVVP